MKIISILIKRMTCFNAVNGIRRRTTLLILSILVDTLNSYKEDSYAAIGRAA